MPYLAIFGGFKDIKCLFCNCVFLLCELSFISFVYLLRRRYFLCQILHTFMLPGNIFLVFCFLSCFSYVSLYCTRDLNIYPIESVDYLFTVVIPLKMGINFLIL